jgi:hypothetical protein
MKSKPQYSSLQVQSSSNNLPLPLCWGLIRLAPNLMWYGDFAAHKQSAGGKGGGGKGGTQYTYSASLQMAICQGVSTGIQRVFRDNEKNASLSSLGLTFFDGADPQSAWSYLVANHPEAALSYPGTVHVDKANYDLGNSASLPQHSFETEALRYNTQVGGAGDADPALCVFDLLTLPIGGAGFPETLIDEASLLSGPDAPTTGDSAFQTYCQAMGFGISPALTTQEQCIDVLDRWGKILNTAVIWNGALLKFVPYALETITGNGVTYIPPNTVSASIYTLTDADFISGGGSDGDPQDPVVITRRNPSDTKNRLQMEILNREKEYNAVPVEWVDQALVDQFGSRQDAVFNAHEVCEMAMATSLVSLMGQRNAFRGGNSYKFTLGPAFCLVEPMDTLTIVDPQLGTIDVQVDRIEEDEENNLTFEASQVLMGSTDSTGFTPPDQTSTGNDTGVSAGDVNAPIFIEPTSMLAGSNAQVWAAVSGGDGTDAGPYWGGCFVHVASDPGGPFTEIGEITQPARMGKTTGTLAPYGGTNPDTVHSVGVNIQESAGELISVSASDAAGYASLCYLGGELLSFRDATLTSTYHYTLGGQLYRGLYGTAAGSHLSGVDFARLDGAIFKYQLPTNYIGVPLYFKFQSYNIYGGAVQDLSTCTTYTYTPAGTGYGGGTGGVPTTPAAPSVSASGSYNFVTWTPLSAAQNVIRYDIYRAPGLGASFGSASKINSAVGSQFIDTSVAASTAYTYFIVAVNAVGSSTASAGTSITSGTGVSTVWGAITGTLSAQTDLQNALNAKLSILDDSANWSAGALRASIPQFSLGDNATQGTVTLVRGFSFGGNDYSGQVSFDLAGFVGGAWIGQVTGGGRIQMFRYGTVTGWEFDVTPYVGANPIWHEGNNPKIIRLYGGIPDKPDLAEELFDIEMTGDEGFLAAMAGSLGSCDIAPTGAVSLPLLKNGTPVGSMDIAAAATTATFTLASALSFASGDRFSMQAPSPKDATLSGIRYTLVGQRS